MCLTSVLISLLYFLPISVDSLRIFNSKCHEPQLNFYQFCYLKSHLLRPTTKAPRINDMDFGTMRNYPAN